MTPEHVELTFELAGLGSRLLAILIDTLLQALVLILLGVLLIYSKAAVWSDISRGAESTWVEAVFILVIFALVEGYFLYFEATSNGQTPGKKSVGIRVIRDTGHPLDFRSAFLRNIMRAVDSLPGVYMVGFISVFFSSEYRRLGDIVAGTLVVKTHPKALPISTNADISDSATPNTGSRLPEEAIPYLNLVTKEDYRAVRHFLDRRRELEPDLVESFAQKIAQPLVKKLHLEDTNMADRDDSTPAHTLGVEETHPASDALADPITFLEQLAAEWERQKIR
jgi:uncharacterized RDD family membrane protein YckC